MEEIAKPSDFKRYHPKWFYPMIIIAGIVTASAILIPYIISLNQSKELKGFVISGYGNGETDSSNNSFVLRLDLSYYNEYPASFLLENQTLKLWMQNNSRSPWQEVGSLYNNQSFPVPAKGSCVLNTFLNVSNSGSDAIKRIFIGTILMHGNFTVKITGDIIVGNKSAPEVPDILQVDTKKEAKLIFGFAVPDVSPSLFLINDLHTPGVDPANPSKFQLGISANYANPLPFEVNFTSLTAVVLNRTQDGVLGDFNLSPTTIGLVSANSSKNFTVTFFILPPQIGWIVSDLISSIKDVVKLRNMAGSIKIGNVSINFNREFEIESNNLSFKLTIINYVVDGVDLYFDVEFINPCDIIFNLTYLDLKMYLSNTFQKLVWIDQAMDLSIPQYSTTLVKHLKVNANVPSFLQHAQEKFDLVGKLTVKCFNYNGDIPFTTYDVQIITI